MNRLRFAFHLLVAAPAVAFAALGTRAAVESRRALDPVLTREAAGLAAQRFGHERQRLRARLDGSPQRLFSQFADLGLLRFAIYDTAGRVLAAYPEGPPLPLIPAADRAAAMLAAARLGAVVVDLVELGARQQWLAYVPGDGRIAVALLRPDSRPLQRFSDATGYDLAVYVGRRPALWSGGPWPKELPAVLLDSLSRFDRPLTASVGGTTIAAAPIKDFDEWETIGAAAVTPTDTAPTLPALPFIPILALVFALALAVLAVHRWTRSRRAGGDGRAYVLLAPALIAPALASLWLAASDAGLSAQATDALLELGERAITAVDSPASLPPARLSALSGAQTLILRPDARGAASAPALLELRPDRLSRPGGRTRIAERRLAYRVVDLSPGVRLVLTRAPLEDSRKVVSFWLAGLYALFVSCVFVYASLARAARDPFELREAATAWTFIAPSLALLLIFSAGPLLFALYLGFHAWNLVEPMKPFVGLQNYIELAGDSLFWNAAKNTLIYSLYVPVTMLCSLAVAILLNRSARGIALLRALFFLPYVTSFVALSIVWQWMYDPDFGLINWALGHLGLGPFPWLNSPSTALLALLIMAVWIHIGFQMVIFLAGLQAIPKELYEAAMIDGAGAWWRFRRITLPLLRPTTFFVLVTSIIGSFQVFTFVYVMTEGGPLHATDVVVYYIYRNAWQFLRMGYASAMSWVLFIVIFAVTLLQFRLLGRRVTPTV